MVLRFNYRGVNLSEGSYDEGEGELEDARACLAVLRERYPDVPITLAGFSFGSRVALRLGCQVHPLRIIAVGFPTTYRERDYLKDCTVPRFFVQSSNDEFGPLVEWEPVIAALPEPKQTILIPAQDHFFAGSLDALEQAIFELPFPPV